MTNQEGPTNRTEEQLVVELLDGITAAANAIAKRNLDTPMIKTLCAELVEDKDLRTLLERGRKTLAELAEHDEKFSPIEEYKRNWEEEHLICSIRGVADTARDLAKNDSVPTAILSALASVVYDEEIRGLLRRNQTSVGTQTFRQSLMWALHNLFSHPLMEIVGWFGLNRLANWVHDVTVPAGESKITWKQS